MGNVQGLIEGGELCGDSCYSAKLHMSLLSLRHVYCPFILLRVVKVTAKDSLADGFGMVIVAICGGS